jgi:AraC-like DNA-binding protein
MGLSPKEYLRVSRFLHSLEVLKKDNSHLTGVAYESGYYDQAHFIHEYKVFSGLTPGELKMTGNILYLMSVFYNRDKYPISIFTS